MPEYNIGIIRTLHLQIVFDHNCIYALFVLLLVLCFLETEVDIDLFLLGLCFLDTKPNIDLFLLVLCFLDARSFLPRASSLCHFSNCPLEGGVLPKCVSLKDFTCRVLLLDILFE